MTKFTDLFDFSYGRYKGRELHKGNETTLAEALIDTITTCHQSPLTGTTTGRGRHDAFQLTMRHIDHYQALYKKMQINTNGGKIEETQFEMQYATLRNGLRPPSTLEHYKDARGRVIKFQVSGAEAKQGDIEAQLMKVDGTELTFKVGEAEEVHDFNDIEKAEFKIDREAHIAVLADLIKRASKNIPPLAKRIVATPSNLQEKFNAALCEQRSYDQYEALTIHNLLPYLLQLESLSSKDYWNSWLFDSKDHIALKALEKIHRECGQEDEWKKIQEDVAKKLAQLKAKADGSESGKLILSMAYHTKFEEIQVAVAAAAAEEADADADADTDAETLTIYERLINRLEALDLAIKKEARKKPGHQIQMSELKGKSGKS